MKNIKVLMSPVELSTGGYMKIREKDSENDLIFCMREDFRGKLQSVSWWVNDAVVHCITADSAEFENFRQVGERPEVTVPGTWLRGLGLESRTLLRIKMEFDTFRQDSVWYGYLFWLSPAGDSAADSKAPYLVKVSDDES